MLKTRLSEENPWKTFRLVPGGVNVIVQPHGVGQFDQFLHGDTTDAQSRQILLELGFDESAVSTLVSWMKELLDNSIALQRTEFGTEGYIDLGADRIVKLALAKLDSLSGHGVS